MSLLNGILSQVSDTATVQNLAAKVGLTPEQVEQAVAALGQAHAANRRHGHHRRRADRPAAGQAAARSSAISAARARSAASPRCSRRTAPGLAVVLGSISKF